MSKTPGRNRALCCVCGTLRTVSARYSPRLDENHTFDDGDRDQPGRFWRMTCTLKCATCGHSARHALLRDDVAPAYRDGAEARQQRPERLVVQSAPGYRVTREKRPAEAVRAGRHPGSEYTLTAVNTTSGRCFATAFQFPDFWLIDVEFDTIKLAGLSPLAVEINRGFRVRTEQEAREWMQLFGTLAAAAFMHHGERT